MSKISTLVFWFTLSIINESDAEKLCPTIKLRAQWSARESKAHNFLINPVLYVVIHHTVTPVCYSFSACSSSIRSIQNYHMDELGWDDVGFSFFVGDDGFIYEGVGWSEEGAHTYGWNKKSIGLAFIGSYQGRNASRSMMNAAHKLITCGVELGMLRPNVKVIGANQVTSTVSPGERLYQQIQQWPEWESEP